MKNSTVLVLVALLLVSGGLTRSALASEAPPQVNCSKSDADTSKMTAEQREKMQAACKDQKEHTDCGKSDMEMSNMTAEQREDMQKQCKHQHHKQSDTHKNKTADQTQGNSNKGAHAPAD